MNIPSVTTSRQTAVINLSLNTLWKSIRPCTFEWQKSLVEKTDINGSSRLIHYLDKTKQTIQVTEISDTDKRISWSLVTSEPSVAYTSRDDTICLTEITAPKGVKKQTFIEWNSEFSNDATTEVIMDGNLKKHEAFKDLIGEKREERSITFIKEILPSTKFSLPWWTSSVRSKVICSSLSSLVGCIPTDLVHTIVTYCQDTLIKTGIDDQKLRLNQDVIVCLGYGRDALLPGKIVGPVHDGNYPVLMDSIKRQLGFEKKKQEIQYFPRSVIYQADLTKLPRGTPVIGYWSHWDQGNYTIESTYNIERGSYRLSNGKEAELDKIIFCPMGHLPFERYSSYYQKDVNQSGKNITDSRATTFGYYLQFNPRVENLDLSKNKIGLSGMCAISAAMLTNTALSKLILDRNNIGDLGLNAFVETLSYNSSLKFLSLAANGIGHTGAIAISNTLNQCHSLPLKHLDLSNNDIGNTGARAIVASMKKNSILTYLDIRKNNIGFIGNSLFADLLQINKTLCRLGVQSIIDVNKLRDKVTTSFTLHPDIDKPKDSPCNLCNDAVIIASLFETNTILTKLSICNNTIGASGAEAIAPVLLGPTPLSELILSGTCLDDTGVKTIATALCLNLSLKSLDLSQNSINDASSKYIVDALGKNSKLTDLNLQDNKVGDIFALQLKHYLLSNGSLKILNVSCNHITNKGLKDIGTALDKNHTLTKLDLSKNRIKKIAIRSFVESFENNSTLTCINITGKGRVGYSTANEICKAVVKSPSIQEFASLSFSDLQKNKADLREKEHGNVETFIIGELLQQNTLLTHLDLWNNKIGNVGARGLANALPRNAVMTHLLLGKNLIGDSGAKAIAQALRENSTLQTLDLRKNRSIGKKGKWLVLQTKELHPSLTNLLIF